MDNKRGTVPGYGRGRAVSGNNIVNRPIGTLAPREWYQRFDHGGWGRGQYPFAPLFAGDIIRVPPPAKVGANTNYPPIYKNAGRGHLSRAGRGHLSWADIRQQSQWNGCDISTLDAYALKSDISHYSSNRVGYADGPWGGRGRGILEKTSSDEESSCHSSENNLWGGRGRGRILHVSKATFDGDNFRCKNSFVRGQNRPQFRGGHVKNENICANNKRPPLPLPLEMPLLLENLDINFSCVEQVQHKQKKKQRKSWQRGRKKSCLSESGSVRSAKSVGENSPLQSSLSFESQQNDKETETKQSKCEGDVPNVVPNAKRLVVIKAPVENNVKIGNEEDPSSGVKEQVTVGVTDTFSNVQQNLSEQQTEKCKKVLNNGSKTNRLVRKTIVVKNSSLPKGLSKPHSEIVKPKKMDNSKDEQNSDQK